jgi:hypothetical protein
MYVCSLTAKNIFREKGKAKNGGTSKKRIEAFYAYA